MIKLSVIVPTRNRREVLISRTLPAMFRQEMPVDDFEIIVVVDGSTDGTTQALCDLRPSCSLRVIEQPGRGASSARNNGILAARGNLLLFIDDDILCGPQLFRRHVEAHMDSQPAVVYGSISIAPETPPSILKYANQAWYEKYYGSLEAQKGLNLPKDDYLISNSSMPRATVIDCGAFDENMTAKEDYEMGLRLWKMEVPFRYLPQARASEFFHKPIGHVLRNDGKAFAETDILLSRKHPDYRPYSMFAAYGKTVWWKRVLRRILAEFPVNPVFVLDLPIRICDKLCRFSIMRRAGFYLLGIGRSVVQARTAVKAAGSWRDLEREFGVKLPALLYHRVGPPRQGTLPGLTVSPARFERHVRWLARHGFQGICPADWLRWLREGTPLPKKPVLLTFDDAYEDTAEFALPILRRYGFGGAVYVVTRRVGETNLWDQAEGAGLLRLMNKEQIRFWAGQGIEFGAHSRTHRDLTKLSAGELEDEVAGSKKDLTALLDSPVDSFAYPYGFNNDAVRHMVRRHFAIALTTDEGINDLLDEPYLMRRAYVAPSDPTLGIAWIVRWGTLLYFHDWRGRIRLRTRIRRALGLSAS